MSDCWADAVWADGLSLQEKGRGAITPFKYKGRGSGSPAQLTNCPWCGAKIQPGRDIKVEGYAKGRCRTVSSCGDVLGRCPFRWWLEYGLRLRDQTADDQPLGLGRLRHGALEFAARQAAAVPERDIIVSLLRGG